MFSKRFIFNWNYTVILFFTLTFWLKVNSDLESASNFINWFLSNFGVVLGNFFVFLILILELIVWIYLNYVFFNNASFILDTFHFVVFKFKILFESFFACLPFLSTLKIKKDIKIYKDFDNNLDADKSYNQEDNIINDEEYQALWSFQTFLRKSDKSLNVDLDKTVFYSSEMGEELSEEQSCLEPQCNLNIEGGFNYKSLTEFEDNKLVASGKIKASDIRKQGIISNIVKADYGNLLIDKDSSSYLIDISVFNQRESKSETEDIEYEKEIQKQSMILQETFKEFNINAKLIDVIKGPVVTMYAVCPDKGIKLSKITSISDNIALRLAAVRVRIIAPIPGKEAVGIEIPNKRREFILISEIISSKEFQNDFKVLLHLVKKLMAIMLFLILLLLLIS